MLSSPRLLIPRLCRSGFTLLELLVSMTVLVLMVLFVSQLTNAAATTVSRSGRHIDADSQARLVFSRMELDFSRMVRRPDLDYSTFKSAQPGLLSSPPYAAGTATNTQAQAGNDYLAFYAETAGYYSGGGTVPTGAQKSPVSLVAYQMAVDPYNQNGRVAVLRRLAKTLGWEPNIGSWMNMSYLPITIGTRWPGLFDPSQPDPDYQTIGDMVFRLEYTYLLKPTYSAAVPVAARLSNVPWDTNAVPAHTSVNGFQDVAALVVAIAVLDSSSRATVTDYSKLAGTNLFPDAADAAADTTYKGDIAAAWNAVVNAPNFAARADIPPTAAAAVHVYQRYFYLDSSSK